jgi:hypothetical protein
MRVLCFLMLSVAGMGAPLRVLFLGNSYTYYNHLAGLVQGMGANVEARFVTKGGATLEGLYMETEALAVLRGEKWDLVVLQEQSQLGLNQFNGDVTVNRPDAFFTWARIWDAEIRAQGARTVFLNTWARKGRGETQGQLDWAYATIARELRAGLIPAGAAFQNVSGIALYQPDGSHPSAAGSYLAACVAVEILTAGGCAGAAAEVAGIPMDNATGRLKAERGTIVQLPRETAGALQEAAMAAVGRLRADRGYWRMARPVYAGEEAAGSGTGEWKGRWSGETWVYGKKANVTLQFEEREGGCGGTWTVEAAEPATQARMALENCTVNGRRLRFVVKPLFPGVETHEVWMRDGALQGRMTLQTMSPYMRLGGTWTLQRTGK